MQLCTNPHCTSRRNMHKRAHTGTHLHTDMPRYAWSHTYTYALVQMCKHVHTYTHTHTPEINPQSFRDPIPSVSEVPHYHPERSGVFQAPGESSWTWPVTVVGKRGHSPLLSCLCPIKCEQAGDCCSRLCRDLLPSPISQPTPAWWPGEMTTTSAAFAVRRLHLDWPCHLWRKGKGRSRLAAEGSVSGGFA